MQRVARRGEQTLVYHLKRRRGARAVRLRLSSQAQLSLTAPFLFSVKRIEQFLGENWEWIQQRLTELQSQKLALRKEVGKSIHAVRARAKKLFKARLEHYNQFYFFSYNRLSVKDTLSRWGSCSRQKNLNFSHRLFFLPLELVDYVVVHELCHLQEMNHSKKFWELVEKTIPDHKERRKKLKNIEYSSASPHDRYE